MITTKELIKKSNLPVFEAEIILAFVLKKDRPFLLAEPNYKIKIKQEKVFLDLVLKRKQGWPIAYLIKEKGFYDLTLKVNQNVLIPRPETEIMVDILLKNLTEFSMAKKDKLQLIDLGTGSGAIIISLAKNLKDKPIFKKINFWAVDISAAALKLAKNNAKLYNLHENLKFLKSDLLKNLPMKNLLNNNLVITANLPYLTPLEFKNEASLKYEPKLALTAGHDGLKYYRQLLKSLNSLPFKSLSLIMEINPNQKNNLLKLVKKFLPNSQQQIYKDLRGQIRFIALEIK